MRVKLFPALLIVYWDYFPSFDAFHIIVKHFRKYDRSLKKNINRAFHYLGNNSQLFITLLFDQAVLITDTRCNYHSTFI